MTPTKINIACGDSFMEGWINLDYSPTSPLVQKADLLAPLQFDDESVDIIYCSHFIEHIPRSMILGFFKECFRVLKQGGRVRFVCPDLEELCHTYLNERNAGQHAKADFLMLEMLDQCVRTTGGGELLNYYEALNKSPELHREMIDYVKARTGYVINLLQANNRSRWGKVLSDPRRLLFKFQEVYCKAIIKLLPRTFRLQNVSLTPVGERHTWIYDFYSIEQLLLKSNFSEISKLNPYKSKILDFPFFPLDICEMGLPRKGLESMYIEAYKA